MSYYSIGYEFMIMQISTITEQKQTSITQLEEQLKEYQERNEALRAELENLKLEAADKSALQARVEELEEKLLVTEAELKKEVKS